MVAEQGVLTPEKGIPLCKCIGSVHLHNGEQRLSATCDNTQDIDARSSVWLPCTAFRLVIGHSNDRLSQ